jgi:hypothetical protein
MKTTLEYRMYGLVPYNLSPIQQGIQFGHAVVDYRESIERNKELLGVYKAWAKKDKTFIILNGGTTNNTSFKLGTLNKHMFNLIGAGIKVQEFHEPDLNDALTAICFLVDERVFNKEKYPDFVVNGDSPIKIQNKEYSKWVESIGGKKNAFLRDYLKPLRLA